MNRRIMVALLLAAAGLMAAPPAIVGTWDCTTTDPDGNPIRALLTVKEDGGKLTGAVTVEDIVAPIFDVVANGGNARFKTTIQERTYEVELKISGSTFVGAWTGGARKGTLKGTRKS